MKKLSSYLFFFVLSFLAPSFADDIRDFQIEGVTIGNSLLDYISEEEIKENVGYSYPDKKFTIVMIKTFTENYDWGVGATYKSKDKKYKIHGVQGRKSFSNIEDCYRKQDEIVKEISSMFTEIEKKTWGILKLNLKGQATEGSKFKPISFDFNDGSAVNITCYYYHDEPPHLLKVSITSKELSRYLEE